MRYLLCCFLLVSCSPSTLQEIRWEGEAETRKLAGELRVISTREELQKALPRIKKRYNKMAQLVLEAERWKGAPPQEPSGASEELFIQLARLYEIPGARELIEDAQQGAIRKLGR